MEKQKKPSPIQPIWPRRRTADSSVLVWLCFRIAALDGTLNDPMTWLKSCDMTLYVDVYPFETGSQSDMNVETLGMISTTAKSV